MELIEYNPGLLQKQFLQWSIPDISVGIVTAANSTAFKGTQFLFSSLKDKIQFLCYDLGLTKSQLTWCKKYGLTVKPLSYPSYLKNISHWPFYVKPWAIENSPYPYTIWVDSDCIVVGDLAKAELINNKQTFFVKYFLTKTTQRKNKEYVYEHYPTKASFVEWDYINSGVFGINKTDLSIINKWQNMIEICAYNDQIKNCFVCQDEGVLNWALQLENSTNLITNDLRYNFHATHNTKEFPLSNVHKSHKDPYVYVPPTPIPSRFCKSLQQHRDKFVLHFATGLNFSDQIIDKYYNIWD